jgi:hypothetical protein
MDVECFRNVMAHAQKPDFVFRRNGRVHLNRRGLQFSRLLAAEVCASALVMLDTPRSEVVWEYWLPTPFASFPFTSPPVRHRVPSGFNWTLPLTTHPVWTGKFGAQGSEHSVTVVEKWITQTLRVGPTGRYTRSQNSELSAFQLHLAKAYADRSACSITKECCMIQPTCC